jgi:hypothetical protein
MRKMLVIVVLALLAAGRSYAQEVPEWEIKDLPYFVDDVSGVTANVAAYADRARIKLMRGVEEKGDVQLRAYTQLNGAYGFYRCYVRRVEESHTVIDLGEDRYWIGYAVVAEFRPGEKIQVPECGHVQGKAHTHLHGEEVPGNGWLMDGAEPGMWDPCAGGLGDILPKKKNQMVLLDMPGCTFGTPPIQHLSAPIDGIGISRGTRFRTFPVAKGQGKLVIDSEGKKIGGVRYGMVPGFWKWSYYVEGVIPASCVIDPAAPETWTVTFTPADTTYVLALNPTEPHETPQWVAIPEPYPDPETPEMHDAVQQAYKLIVKTAYGYRGTWTWDGTWPPEKLPELPGQLWHLDKERLKGYLRYTMEEWR